MIPSITIGRFTRRKRLEFLSAGELLEASIVLFDLGNVLTTWDVGPRIAEYAHRSGLSPAIVLERLSRDDFWVNTDRGSLSADEMETQICGLLDCHFSREELLALQAIAFELRPEVLDIARAVAIRKPVGILTNNAPFLQEAMPKFFPELVELFDPILYSFQFGHVKPERELFEAVEDKLDLPAEEIYFIDDTQGHVAAARAAGWDAVQYQSTTQLRNSLAERGLLDDSA